MAEAYKQILEDEGKVDEIVKVAFENVNTNNSGAIDKGQLETVMNQIFNDLSNELPTKKEVDEVFNYLDSNKKGSLNPEDFKVLIKDILKSLIEEYSSKA